MLSSLNYLFLKDQYNHTLGNLYPLWYSFIIYSLLIASSVKRSFAASHSNFLPLRKAMFPICATVATWAPACIGQCRSSVFLDFTTLTKFSQCFSTPLSEEATKGLLTLLLLPFSSITSHPPRLSISVPLLPI